MAMDKLFFDNLAKWLREQETDIDKIVAVTFVLKAFKKYTDYSTGLPEEGNILADDMEQDKRILSEYPSAEEVKRLYFQMIELPLRYKGVATDLFAIYEYPEEWSRVACLRDLDTTASKVDEINYSLKLLSELAIMGIETNTGFNSLDGCSAFSLQFLDQSDRARELEKVVLNIKRNLALFEAITNKIHKTNNLLAECKQSVCEAKEKLETSKDPNENILENYCKESN